MIAVTGLSCSLSQSFNVQKSVHCKPFERQVQFGSWQRLLQRHDNNSNTSTGAGSPLIQLTTSLSSSRLHPCPAGEGICMWLWRLQHQIAAWQLALSQILRRVSMNGGNWLESSLGAEEAISQVIDIFRSRIWAVHEPGELLKTWKQLIWHIPICTHQLEELSQSHVSLRQPQCRHFAFSGKGTYSVTTGKGV